MLAAGAIIGGIIGYVVVGWEYLVDGSAMRFLRTGTQGCLLGALGGALGLVLGELINYALQMGAWLSPLVIGVLARGLGWMVFGLTIGLAEGWVARSLLKTSYGAVGGSLGGFFGGAVFAALLIGSQRQEWTYVWGQASALVILGASIGSLIASVEEALKPASVKILRGWREGREFSILKRETTLGRDERADILLLRDMKVENGMLASSSAMDVTFWSTQAVLRNIRWSTVVPSPGNASSSTAIASSSEMCCSFSNNEAKLCRHAQNRTVPLLLPRHRQSRKRFCSPTNLANERDWSRESGKHLPRTETFACAGRVSAFEQSYSHAGFFTWRQSGQRQAVTREDLPRQSGLP
jgi:hypothetical protein